MNSWLLGWREGWGERKVRDWHVYTAVFKMDNKQGPTVNSATMNSELCSMLWQPGWEASLGESGCMSTCGWVPSPYLKLSQPCLSTGYAPIQNKKFKKQKIKHKLSTWRLWIYFLSPQFTFVGWIAASHLYSQWQLNQQRWGLGTW